MTLTQPVERAEDGAALLDSLGPGGGEPDEEGTLENAAGGGSPLPKGSFIAGSYSAVSSSVENGGRDARGEETRVKEEKG